MRTSENDPDVEHEPHRRGGGFQTDPSETAAATNPRYAARAETDDDRVEHTVWDEPALSPALSGRAPDSALTYAKWIEQRMAGMSAGRSWGLVFVISLAAGPWAILGAWGGGGRSWLGLLTIAVFGPVLEEMMKVSVPLWVVEKRPFFFRSRAQIAVCVLAGGFVFAAVENLLYLHVYIAGASQLLIRWRWTTCVTLHMGCSFIAGLGLMRIWSQATEQRTRPRLKAAAGYMVTAMTVHGAFNAFAVLLPFLHFKF